jgi:glucose-6-phosphate isomerase
MLSKKINFKNFSIPANDKIVKKDLKQFLRNKDELIKSLSKEYKYRYSNKLIKKLNKFKNIKIIGMGGSILGSKAIYDFLPIKVKKKIFFYKKFKAR